MIKAPIISNEKMRQAELEEYKILNTGVEQNYNDFVQFAAKICKSPISLISFIDNERQWFKAKVGIEVDSTARDISFCGHAIASKEDVFIVTNALKDKRFFDNPLVIDSPAIRFYAGVPIVMPSGHSMGTLCVIDNKPRRLSKKQKESLKILASQVVTQLELRKYRNQVECYIVEINNFKNVLEIHNQKIHFISKMADLGEITANAVHEINNILSLALSRISTIINMLDISQQKDTIQNNLKIQNELFRLKELLLQISKLIISIAHYSRKGIEDTLVPYDLLDVVNEVSELARNRLEINRIRFETEGLESCRIICNPNEISQILINLLNNSIDAVTGLNEKWIKIQGKITEDKIKILIIDSGCGIDPSISEKIMKPFFTTKVFSKGTGLGLSISSELAKKNNGTLEFLHNEKNTTFELCFPNLKIEN